MRKSYNNSNNRNSLNSLNSLNNQKNPKDIAVEAKVRTLPNAEIQSEITSDFLLTRSAILRLLYQADRIFYRKIGFKASPFWGDFLVYFCYHAF